MQHATRKNTRRSAIGFSRKSFDLNGKTWGQVYFERWDTASIAGYIGVPMPFNDLQDFLRYLEQRGQLKRVRIEVDPELEATEISQRVLREQGPALLFERPKGSSTPLLMNLFGSMDRVRAALGREPGEIGHELIDT